jgi:hypothetical protein
MTPIDRAKYLFENYLILFPEFYNDLEYGYNDVKAKQCALILVDEIIKVLVELSKGEFTFIYYVEYWQEVKQEIEKL